MENFSDEPLNVSRCSYCAKYYLFTHKWFCCPELSDYHVCRHCVAIPSHTLEKFGYKPCQCGKFSN